MIWIVICMGSSVRGGWWLLLILGLCLLLCFLLLMFNLNCVMVCLLEIIAEKVVPGNDVRI